MQYEEAEASTVRLGMWRSAQPVRLVMENFQEEARPKQSSERLGRIDQGEETMLAKSGKKHHISRELTHSTK